MGSSSHGSVHSASERPQAAFDPKKVLERIGVAPGHTLLDVGSGAGRFSIPAASMVGEAGKVYAVDTSEESIASLRRAAREHGLTQVEAFVADLTEGIPLPGAAVDICLMANVFHDLVDDGNVPGELTEIRRVLKPGGVLAIVDFKKNVPRPPGPPLSRRLDPEDVERVVAQYGLRRERGAEVGPYHYLILFTMCDTGA